MKKVLASLFALLLVPALASAEGDAPTAPAATAVPAPAATAAPAPQAAAAVTPSATTTATVVAPAVERAKISGFRMSLGLDHSMGHGTLENAETYSEVVGAISVAPSYGFQVGDVKLSASGRASFSYEYTLPNNPTGRHYNWGDIGLGLSAPGIFKEEVTGISFSPRVGFTLPISLNSIFRGTITNMSGGVGMSRNFGPVHVNLSFGASKTFYREITRNIDEEEAARKDALGNMLFICRTDSPNCGLRGVPSLWSMNGGLNVSYSPMDKLNIGVGLNLGKSFSYWIGRDEYSSKKLDSNGNQAVKEQGMTDHMAGSLSISYALSDGIGLSAAMQTAQAPKSADNQRFRFPFYAFEGQENSLTSYSLGLNATF